MVLNQIKRGGGGFVAGLSAIAMGAFFAAWGN